jgi:DNA invertase Pin-like site-specific DNA recombinase
MIYGYARVSTATQDETGQVRQLKAAGCEKVFREKITGTTADRAAASKADEDPRARRRSYHPGR